jgi:hypothetical protein
MIISKLGPFNTNYMYILFSEMLKFSKKNKNSPEIIF